MNAAKRFEIFRRLHEDNPEPKTELAYSTPFELLVAVTLSAQATDVSVNKATAKLFPVANTPEAIYAGVALWLASPAPVAGDRVVPFPHRLPRPELDHVETRLAHHYAGSVEHLLKTTLPRPPRRPGNTHATGAQASCALRRSGATAATPISEVPRPSNDT